MAEMKAFAGPSLDESVSQVTATPSHDLGERVMFKGEEYVYCYNAGGAQVLPEYGVKLVTGCSGYSVAGTSVTDVANPCVGINRHSTAAAADYFWCMTRGFSNVHTSNSIMTGDYIAVGLAAGGGFGEYEGGTATVGTNFVAGYGLNVDTASGGTFYAFINTGF